MLSNKARSIIDRCSIIKQKCVLCGATNSHAGLCSPCLSMLPKLPDAHCPRCADPSPGQVLCGRCQTAPPHFDALHVPYLFGYPLNSLIYAFKYGRQLQLSGVLTNLFCEFARSKAPKYDLVIPVPLANERLAKRGFNQSSELAEAFAVTIDGRFSDNLCWRKCNTLPQASLDLAERRKNVRHAFGVKRRCDGLCIAIVDDVATSGATLSELAKMLKKQGAKRVDGWVLARAFSPKT
ncbi:ComF family protein [Chromobacterium sp. IIBBL 290-4]|uniref:ComF family protein n=1 Tax=Chromobacterium sp. IIBBL 290-4 TaxID=2953890 RepID=UPI0020B6ECF7|nr:ComF family protein [Chromobacterium sp. IIBBL 290-4]UTH75602.1 ComF family protein [Chromobacterium sp. IIBBL 290-4]